MLNAVWIPESEFTATDEVVGLLAAARDVDGRPELDGPAGLPTAFSGGAHLLARVADELVGYAHLDTRGDTFGRQVAELIVHPDKRRMGVGTALVDTLLDAVGARKHGDTLRVWSHGDHPGAARLADRAGLTRARELLRMHLWFSDFTGAELRPPDGVRMRRFVPGQDERAIVDVNARAFAWHPEQAGMSVADLQVAEAEDWFDQNGFFVAENADGGAPGVLGFHWTKVHPPAPEFDDESVGEVYVVGVHPDAQGLGLGKVLTAAGLAHLRDVGKRRVILYVEGDNAPAIAVYERLGFTRWDIDVQYAR